MRRVYAVYKGYDKDLDKRLEVAVGKDSNGTGYAFLGCLRDINWIFRDNIRAKTAVSKLKRFKGVIGIEVYDSNDDLIIEWKRPRRKLKK
jgi:hypothetical protein